MRCRSLADGKRASGSTFSFVCSGRSRTRCWMVIGMALRCSATASVAAALLFDSSNSAEDKWSICIRHTSNAFQAKRKTELRAPQMLAYEFLPRQGRRVQHVQAYPSLPPSLQLRQDIDFLMRPHQTGVSCCAKQCEQRMDTSVLHNCILILGVIACKCGES